MKMKILPYYLGHIPSDLFEENGSPLMNHPDMVKLMFEKVGLIIKQSFEEPKKPEHVAYHEMCKFLGIDPHMALKVSKPEKPEKTVVGAAAKNLKNYRDPKFIRTHGWYPEDVTYLVRQELAKVKQHLASGKGKGNFCFAYHKTCEAIQYKLSNAITEYFYRRRHKPIKDLTLFSKGGEETCGVMSEMRRQYTTRQSREVFDKLIEKKGFYTDGLTNGIKNKKVDPPQTIYLFETMEAYTPYKSVAASTMEELRYQHFDNGKIPKGINPEDCYLDTRGPLARGEEVMYDEKRKCWVPDTSPNRWLCVGVRVNTALLQYSAQPMPLRPELVRTLGNGLTHRVGFEVEFQSNYSKEMCIRNKEGRPLTPSKVLEDHGWAICPDSSVAGGEIKSPVMYFKDAEHVNLLLKQIPDEIKEFINTVAKDGHCGGHVNYSHETLAPLHAMMAIATWGFIWPLIPECDERMLNEKLVNRDGHHFCDYRKITNPEHKYQWIRLKRHCMEVRVFDAHWSVDALLWRAKLVSLLMENVVNKLKNVEYGEYTVLNYPHWENALIKKVATQNWKEFQDRECKIREHLRTTVSNREIEDKIKTTSFASRVGKVLGIQVGTPKATI